MQALVPKAADEGKDVAETLSQTFRITGEYADSSR